MEKAVIKGKLLSVKPKERVKMSFEGGFNQVPFGQIKEVEAKIMTILSITDRQAFMLRLRGKSSHNVAEIAAIESIFKEYGITENIWENVKK